MEQVELTGDLSTEGHTRATYDRMLTEAGFGREHNGLRINFERGLVIDIRETLLGCEIRGFRL